MLGQFEVLIGGEPLPSQAWQSRKARDLLRILVARRGRSVPREELTYLLWPDVRPSHAGHRLSNQLSLIRAVLGTPRSARGARAGAARDVLTVDRATVGLDPAAVEVDAEVFLARVAAGRRAAEVGDPKCAMARLVDAERSYHGDPFEDDPYADWARPLREEARAGYLAAVRLLARLHGEAGDVDGAVGYLLRLLAKDPYDEDAHRARVRMLVTGGRHGEARRAFAGYAAAMHEIDVTAPDPVLLSPGGRQPSLARTRSASG